MAIELRDRRILVANAPSGIGAPIARVAGGRWGCRSGQSQ